MKTRVGIVHRNVPIQARILGVSAVTIESFHPLKHCLAKIYYTKLNTRLIGKEILEKELKKLFL